MMSSERAEVVDLRRHTRFRPNVAELARNQLGSARRSQEMSRSEFAETLTGLVGWPVTTEAVRAWEETAVPPGDILVAAGMLAHSSPTAVNAGSADVVGQVLTDRYADVTAVYGTRAEFASEMSAATLFDDSREIRAMGLSLNLLCQHYSVGKLAQVLERGGQVEMLFLDPDGDSIKAREAEEGYPPGHLAALTTLNVQTIEGRVRAMLSEEGSERLRVRIYDEPIRFNVLLVDGKLCIMQPYLPGSRGVDSPTFVIRRRWSSAGLYSSFDAIFQDLSGRSRAV